MLSDYLASTSLELSSEVVSADTWELFIWLMISGLILGAIWGVAKRITRWIW